MGPPYANIINTGAPAEIVLDKIRAFLHHFENEYFSAFSNEYMRQWDLPLLILLTSVLQYQFTIKKLS